MVDDITTVLVRFSREDLLAELERRNKEEGEARSRASSGLDDDYAATLGEIGEAVSRTTGELNTGIRKSFGRIHGVLKAIYDQIDGTRKEMEGAKSKINQGTTIVDTKSKFDICGTILGQTSDLAAMPGDIKIRLYASFRIISVDSEISFLYDPTFRLFEDYSIQNELESPVYRRDILHLNRYNGFYIDPKKLEEYLEKKLDINVLERADRNTVKLADEVEKSAIKLIISVRGLPEPLSRVIPVQELREIELADIFKRFIVLAGRTKGEESAEKYAEFLRTLPNVPRRAVSASKQGLLTPGKI